MPSSKNTNIRCQSYTCYLSDRASKSDQFIILVLVDEAYADMAINLYLSSFKPYAIDNFLFVGVGRRACEILWNFSSTLPCYVYRNDTASNDPSNYHSPDFIRKVNIRGYMIREALEAGFTVLNMDVDLFFFRDPLPDLRAATKLADIATMIDGVMHNAGFLVVRPTVFGKMIYERVTAFNQSLQQTDDQDTLGHVLKSMKEQFNNLTFKVVPLSTKKYQCGWEYFLMGKRHFPKNCSECLLVHNNWIISRDAKIYRFREHYMWHYDKNGYYSNTSALYLAYENPVVWSDQRQSAAEEVEALKSAIAIGSILGRIVIVPRFHCFTDDTIKPSPTEKQQSNITVSPPIKNYFDCPLFGVLYMPAFDSFFANKYRESTFLTNQFVPNKIKSDQSPANLIVTRENRDLMPLLMDGNVAFYNATNSSLDAVEVTRFFGRSPYRVLFFKALYRTMPKFENSGSGKQLMDSFNRAFKRLL